MNFRSLFSGSRLQNAGIWVWVILACPIIVEILAIKVLIEWVSHPASYLQSNRTFIPMQFNTALCFFLLSTSFLLGLFNKYRRLCIALALIGGAVAVITLAQYLFNTNFGIDLFFINPFIISSTYPGRMAPTTGLAFVIFSFSLILLTHPQPQLSDYKAFTISLFACLSFALGLAPILGLLTNINQTYADEAFLNIPFESACCFVLLSIATISYAWNCSEKAKPWLPIPIFIAFTAVTFLMSAAVYNKELNRFKQILVSNTYNAAILTQQTIDNLLGALSRMANRWEVGLKTPTILWHADAHAYIQDFPYLLALEILDKNFIIQSIEPVAGNSFLLGKNLNQDPERKQVIQKAIDTRRLVMSNALTLKQGGQGFLCFIPLFTNDEFKGMIVAVFRVDEFFNSIFSKNRFPSYFTTVYEQGIPIFSNSGSHSMDISKYQYKMPVSSKIIHWDIALNPNADVLGNKISPSYLVVFCFGLLMSLILTMCIYLIIKADEKSNALIDSENRYKMILDGVKDYAIFMLTPDGHVKSWNIGAQRIKGYTDKEILGKHFSIFYTPEDIAKNTPDNILNIARLKGRYEGEGIRIRKNGSQFSAKTLVEPLYDTNGNLAGFVKISQDITDLRQMELDHLKLIALVEESSDFVGIADLEGHLQYHNRSAKLMVGLPESCDMSQMKIEDMHPDWAAKKIFEKVIPLIFKNGSWTGETALRHQSGREISVLQSITLHRDAMGNPECLTTIMRDITVRKAKEDAIKASEETFRAAMQYASIGMALVSAERKWLKVNQSLCHMLGYTEQEMLHSDFRAMTYPEDDENDSDKLMQMLDKKIAYYQMEKRYLHKKGYPLSGLVNITLLWNSDGTPKYFIMQIQDITARKQAEQANKQLITAFANSNSELERFAYVASHDLQEPIRMINNFSELLLTEKQGELDNEAKDYLRIMTNAGIRMREMISDLLTYSRVGKEAETFVIFNTEDIFNNVLENIKTLIEEHKALITHDPLPELYGNPLQMMRLFQNLMVNAIKYQPLDQVPIIHIGLADTDKNWLISIVDNGLGIDERFVAEIFEPFRRLHSWDSVNGSGLGLSICKKIAELHGGTITVESIVGKGSSFTLTIPKRLTHKGI